MPLMRGALWTAALCAALRRHKVALPDRHGREATQESLSPPKTSHGRVDV